jgi:hypothetical protein
VINSLVHRDTNDFKEVYPNQRTNRKSFGLAIKGMINVADSLLVKNFLNGA